VNIRVSYTGEIVDHVSYTAVEPVWKGETHHIAIVKVYDVWVVCSGLPSVVHEGTINWFPAHSSCEYETELGAYQDSTWIRYTQLESATYVKD